MPMSFREHQFFELQRARRLRPPRNGFLDKTLRRLAAFFAASCLREEIARRPGIAQRLHPRARLLAALCFLLSLSLASSLSTLGALALLVAAVVPLARIRVRELLESGLLIAIAFSGLMALPATLNLVSGGRVLLPLLQRDEAWRLGPYVLPPTIGVSAEGLRTAATLLLRTLASVTAVLCLALSTRWTELLASLRSLQIPPLFLQTAGMTVRYLYLLLSQSEEIHFGKKSRTICRRALASDQAWVGSRVAAVWERNLHLMRDVSEAMTARGFTGEVRFAPGRPLHLADWGFLLLTAALCVGAHFA